MGKRRRRGRHGRSRSQGRPGERRACSRKRRYPTKLHAEVGQATVLNRSGHAKGIYRCPFCGGWHLGGHATR